MRVKKDVEIWLVDEKEVLLFRKLKSGKEQILPIKDNRDMLKFMCIDQREYKGLYEALIDGSN